MNKQNYTSLKLSKLLADKGFKGDSELVYLNEDNIIRHKRHDNLYNPIPVYDILNDLCVKYCKEVFGKEKQQFKIFSNRKQELKIENYIACSTKIISLLQQNKKEEAEDFIIKQSIIFK